MSIKITKVNSCTFEGYIHIDDLNFQQLKTLGIDSNLVGIDELQIEGEFSLEWDDDIPLAVIESIYVVNGGLDLELEFDDTSDLESQIENNGPILDWTSDRQAALTDYYYDLYKDGGH